MITALVIALLVLFGVRGDIYLGEIDESIKQIEDKNDRKEARDALKRIKSETKSFYRYAADHRRDYDEIDFRYDSTANDYWKALRALEAEWARGDERFFEEMIKIRNQMTREQWEALHDSVDEKWKAHLAGRRR